MKTLFGINVLESSLVPSEVPAIEVRDIKHADGTSILSEEFRARENAYYRERFGMRQVAYIFDTRALGLFGTGEKVIAMNPRHAAMLKNFL